MILFVNRVKYKVDGTSKKVEPSRTGAPNNNNELRCIGGLFMLETGLQLSANVNRPELWPVSHADAAQKCQESPSRDVGTVARLRFV